MTDAVRMVTQSAIGQGCDNAEGVHCPACGGGKGWQYRLCALCTLRVALGLQEDLPPAQPLIYIR